MPGFAEITAPHCCEEKKEDSQPRPAADVASHAFLFTKWTKDIEAWRRRCIAVVPFLPSIQRWKRGLTRLGLCGKP